eukprot:SAG11_NODE_124_length_15798_cov_14.675776_14_plen_60_part_00
MTKREVGRLVLASYCRPNILVEAGIGYCLALRCSALSSLGAESSREEKPELILLISCCN